MKKAITVNTTLVEAHCKPRNDDDEHKGDADGAWRGFPVKKEVRKDGTEIISLRMALYGY